MEYGGISFATTAFAPMIHPSPTLTPGIIVTFCPIQTSFPITVSLLCGTISLGIVGLFSINMPKGNAEIPFIG